MRSKSLANFLDAPKGTKKDHTIPRDREILRSMRKDSLSLVQMYYTRYVKSAKNLILFWMRKMLNYETHFEEMWFQDEIRRT